MRDVIKLTVQPKPATCERCVSFVPLYMCANKKVLRAMTTADSSTCGHFELDKKSLARQGNLARPIHNKETTSKGIK